MRLLKAMIQASALILGTVLFANLIAFLTKLDSAVVADIITFVGVFAIFTGLFYIDTYKQNEDKVRKEDMESEGRQILPVLVQPNLELRRQAKP